MNWKDEATEKLKKYDAMRIATRNIPQELTRLEQVAKSLHSPNMDDPVQSTNLRSREDSLLNNMVHRQELNFALQQAELWLDVTDRALGALTPEEKLILHRLYIYPERGAIERLCGELGIEQSSIYRKRDKALHRFTLALYGTVS